MIDKSLDKAIVDAMWAGDTDKLNELAPCRCCCHEHTYDNCPARVWHGCRGQNSFTFADQEAWQRHFEKYHGMTYSQYYDIDDLPEPADEQDRWSEYDDGSC